MLTWDKAGDLEPTGALSLQSGSARSFDDVNGFDLLAGLDFGLELDFGGLFLDVMLQNVFQMSRGMKPEGAPASAWDNGVQWFIGPTIRPGYRFFGTSD
jgi:hypothetical protein